MTDDFLFLTTAKAAEYLSCSRDELIAWVKPDRRMPGQVGPGTGERRWSKQTLDRALPDVDAWRAARSRRSGLTRCGKTEMFPSDRIPLVGTLHLFPLCSMHRVWPRFRSDTSIDPARRRRSDGIIAIIMRAFLLGLAVTSGVCRGRCSP